MGDRHDYVALEWVKGEIAETLTQARQALEAYVDNPQDVTRMRFCLTYAHQVHGTLQMVEFYGAALLAEEIERLARALLDERVANRSEALELLMQAILQLPLYLDHIQAARRDLPLIVMPLLNDLRAVRGERLLSETSLFTPDLGDLPLPLAADALLRLEAGELPTLLRKMRQMLQVALVAVIRNQEVAVNLGYMSKVFNRLENLSQNAPLGLLWAASAGLVEGMIDGCVTLSSSVRNLLREVDRELKLLSELGVEGFNRRPPDGLVRNLLFYVAKAPAATPRLGALKERYRLDDALFDSSAVNEQRAQLAGPDRETLRSVVGVLCEELVRVKDSLDLFVRGDRQSLSELAALQQPLKQISDTLAILSFGQPRKIILDQYALVQALASGQREVGDAILMDIAGALLYVEATLAGMAGGPGSEEGGAENRLPTTDVGQIHQLVVKEARSALSDAKDAIIEFIASQWNHEHLEKVPGLLGQARGGLGMIPLERAAALLDASQRYILEEILARRAIPSWQNLDTLADAITSVEYYLERLNDDRSSQGDHILDVAEESLAALGYGLAAFGPAMMATGSLSEAPLAASATIEAEGAMAPVEVPSPELAELAIAAASPHHTEAEAEAEAELVLAAVLAVSEPAINPPAISTPPAILPPPGGEEPVDEELLEVFIEEAGEVLETINEYLPAWFAEPGDGEALTEVRRAFHTLKGSGRMVRALIIGELSWSVENLLNRVLDKSVQPNEPLRVLLQRVVDLLSSLVDEFAARQQCQRADVDALAEAAHALARGETIALAGETPSSPSDVPGAELPVEFEPDRAVALELQQADGQDSETRQPHGRPVVEALDPQLVEIFRNEAEAHLDAVDAFLAQCDQQLPQPVSDGLQRALHTLKGSAHMAGILPIAEIVTPLEKLAKEYKNNLIRFDLIDVELLRDAASLLRQALERLDVQPLLPKTLAEELKARIQALHLSRLGELSAEPRSTGDQQREVGRVSRFLMAAMNSSLDVEDVLQRWRQRPAEAAELTDLVGELASLERGAQVAELPQIESLCHALQQHYAAVGERGVRPGAQFLDLAEAGHEALAGMMDEVAAGLQASVQEELLRRLEDFHAQTPAPAEELLELLVLPAESPAGAGAGAGAEAEAADLDQEMVEIFLEEAVDLLESAGQSLEYWLGEPEEKSPLASLQRDLHTLKGGARMAGIVSVGDLAHELEFLYEGLLDGRYAGSADLNLLLQQAHDRLAAQIESLQAGRMPGQDRSLVTAIEAYRRGTVAVPAAQAVPVPDFFRVDEAEPAEPAAAVQDAVSGPQQKDEGDQELVEVFLEEAFDILDSAGQALQRWIEAPEVLGELHSLQRDLHTLKGGARMAEITAIGDLAHELEFVYEGLYNRQHPPGSALCGLLQASHDRLIDMLDCLRLRQAVPDGHAELLAIRAFRSGGESALATTVEREPTAPVQLEQAQEPVSRRSAAVEPDSTDAGTAQAQAQAPEATAGAEADAAAGLQPLMAPAQEVQAQVAKVLPFVRLAQQAAEQAAASRAPQEMVRVPADLLEGLVNLAGETSIFRGRVEQQVSDFSFTLSEMDATIERVRDQLRRLDTETQAQILSRYHAEGERAGYEDFDPLEMDRHSQLQQLSRALFESASDLLDLKETLAARSRDAETLLLQQARVNTELQEGLMRTRMVPFDRVVPRLRRLVRQVSAELGKQVEFVAGNAEGEMDRSVLERIIAPLEHMLRNAVDHGIESREQRRGAGKPEQGSIRLDLQREGADILLSLSDDGGGIDLEAVRRKARERCLLPADRALADEEVLQFILAAGFSTAKKVTQISGRGVGLDVVNSEVKQLGGSMSIESRLGQGTRFLIRLPFTVSVNRALMVNAGEDLYAIPLSTIEGIVRISPQRLQTLYQPGAPRFEYADRAYELRYLGDLLGTGQQPKLVGQTLPLPVVLLRSGEYSIAVQVDSLAGSREIVVKGLGPQFAAVPGISGATILGDGRVVVILDLVATIRAQQARQVLTDRHWLDGDDADDEAEGERPTLVMVVDDSVTVRKVTGRLLERQGMNVLTAKDGADAISQLQEHRPDIMLLDIEMPRMDGFEVATLVRHDERLKDLPIIMITSRTGEKHRERAMGLGVNEYLGKPYQESVLLEAIHRLVAEKHD
ncbi:Hpt domain-containing protein [Stutzerimonas tarimensis]|uniref:histidine kinase n=1 Tax=Stutzerimonas tarimensis TaxID=1507735 RepID=A0ABV7T7T6_9GAMM